MRIRSAAAAVRASGAERAERHDRTDGRVHYEAAVGDIHATRYADITAVIGVSSAGVHGAAFGAVAGITPGHQVLFLFEKRVEIGVGSGDECVARVPLFGGNGVPFFFG